MLTDSTETFGVFQFTPARGGRPYLIRRQMPFSTFQFTPARGGRLDCRQRLKPRRRFNSRPRVAGDLRAFAARNHALSVSIHARAWRATVAFAASPPESVFQFTPARGGRLAAKVKYYGVFCFNSRPRVAGDRTTRETS